MEFQYSTTWNSNIPLHRIQAFQYMEFKHSTTWNSSIPLHGIQAFHYMEFKHSTTWNSSIPLHGIQVFHYMEFKYSTTFKLAKWIGKFHHMKLMVPFTTNLKLIMDLTDFQYVSGFIFHSYSCIYFKI